MTSAVEPTRLFVVVSGPPGSGKSTLSRALRDELGFPLIAKDTVKDALMDCLPVQDKASSADLGRAANAVMFAVAAQAPTGAILDSNLHRSQALDDLNRLPGRVIELFCRCKREVALSRYSDRAGTRHAGHFDEARTADELWHDEVTEPVAGSWPLLEVDTNEPVDIASVVQFVESVRTSEQR